MKKRISVRLLTVLGGLVLLALAGCVAAEGFFGVPVTASIGKLFASTSAAAVLIKLASVILLAVLACATVLCSLPARRQKPSEFVMQKGENGMIGISIRAIEKQVHACVDKHDEFADVEVAIRECRDGLIILLNVDQVAGVSIPLSVGQLQKQIKQYVVGCTGVDVHEVRVMVENNTSAVIASPYAVEEPLTPVQRPVQEESRAAEPVRQTEIEPAQPAAEPVPAAPAAPAAPVVLPELPPIQREPELEEEDERPLHQRIFGTEEQPVFVPAPPVMPEEPAVPAQEETTGCEEAEEPAAEEAVPQEAAEPEMLEALPDEAAEAGAAYCEALWADDDSAVQVEEADADAAPADEQKREEADLEDEEAQEKPLNLLD